MGAADIPSFVPPELIFRPHRITDLLGIWDNPAIQQLPLVVYRDLVEENAQKVANHHEDFCSLYVIRSGRGLHVIEGVEYAVARGDVYVMGPGMTHWFRNGDELTTDTVHFSPTLFREEERKALHAMPGFHSLFVDDVGGKEAIGQRWVHLTPTSYEAITGEIAELRAEWQRGTPESALLTRALFLRLLVHLSRSFTMAQMRSEQHSEAQEDTVAAAVRFMETNFAGPLRIEQVAAVVCLSPDRFTEVFARAMGRTPRDYLRHLRMERARMLLATTDSSVEEIARQSGFGNAAYLARVLKTTTGQTPRAVRKQDRR